MKNQIVKTKDVLNNNDSVVDDIINIIDAAQANAYRAVNIELVKRNWLIGKRIHEEILTDRKQDYGKQLIKKLSALLSKYGNGFNDSDLRRYHNFYLKFPNLIKFNKKTNIWAPTVPNSLLPWTFYRILLPIKSTKEALWYVNETKKCLWSKNQLERNIKTDYYYRILSNQIENKPNEISIINQNDYFKSLYIFDFLKIKDKKYKESDLEEGLINNLKKFMLELGIEKQKELLDRR